MQQVYRGTRRKAKMRNVMWIYVLVVFSSESWSQEPGTNETTSVKSNTTSPPPKVYVYKNEVFNVGSSVNLTCGDKTWTETLFVIWILNLKHKTCRILFNNDDGQYINTCNDGKSLRNNTLNQPYLHIPNISADDVGLYQCESVYKGGNENYNISVTLIVPPTLSAWLERRYNKLAAGCRAEGGSPAANISWSLTGTSQSVQTSGSGGFLTVQSDLELPGGMNPENLTCIVRHQFWDHEEILVPEVRRAQAFKPFQIIIPVAVVVIVLLVGFTALALKKVQLLRRCQLSDTPTKSPPMEDVEEVEPYASYVQRVNSIYN